MAVVPFVIRYSHFIYSPTTSRVSMMIDLDLLCYSQPQRVGKMRWNLDPGVERKL